MRSEKWLVKNNEEEVVDYEPLPKDENVTETRSKIRPRIEKKEVEKSTASHFGDFVLSDSKRIMKKFVPEIDGFLSNIVYYQATNSFYTNMDHYGKVKKAGDVVINLRQAGNGYGGGGLFFSILFSGSKKKTELAYRQLWNT